VVERHFRVGLQANHPCIPCSSTGANDVRRRVRPSGQSGTERREQLSIDEAEQEASHESLHWTRVNDLSGADLEGQRASQRAFRFYQAQKFMNVEKLSKAMMDIHAQVAEKATRNRKAAIQKHNE
jgi:hypothetical protein